MHDQVFPPKRPPVADRPAFRPRPAACGRRGTSSVEFAIIGLAFLSLLFLICEAAWQVTVALALEHGARAASRFGITGNAVSGVTRNQAIADLVVSSSGGVLVPGRLILTMESFPSLGTLGDASKVTAGGGGSGEVVRYTLLYPQPLLTPLARALVGDTIQHRAVTVIQNEPF